MRGTKNPSKVGGPVNELTIHSHAVGVRVPDLTESERELGLATSNFGAVPRFDSFSIFKSRDWAVVER